MADDMDDAMPDDTTSGNLQMIDCFSIEECLRLWRFEPCGSPWTTGACGERLGERLVAYRDAHPDDWVALSQHVGWTRETT